MLDSTHIQQAIREFIPKRPTKFQELLSAKDFISELRRKRASYEAIADLLTQHCVPISKSAIAMFCHERLGESVRSRRKPGKKRLPVIASPIGNNSQPPMPKSHLGSVPLAPILNPTAPENPTTCKGGPHIAKVELLPPGESYD